MAWLVGALVLAAMAAAFFCKTSASAQTLMAPVEPEEWSSETALWLARAQVGEGGWTSFQDHDAIAWVLFRRWREAQEERYAGTTFARVIQQYCASLKGSSARAAWLRGLGADGEPPDGWPADARWSAHRQQWLTILERAEEWADGLVEDPTGGKAMHFGAPDDPAPRHHRPVLGINTRNVFYEPDFVP